jgi:hypothetical protein
MHRRTCTRAPAAPLVFVAISIGPALDDPEAQTPAALDAEEITVIL